MSKITIEGTKHKQLCINNVNRHSFFIVIRVFDKYCKTKIEAKTIEEAEGGIESILISYEYQIMNIYKAND